MVQILADAKLLEPIDWSKLPTVKKTIDPKFRKLPFDPKDTYSVAKDWGTTGFMYRSDLVKERPTTWRQFVDLTKTKYSGKVTVLDGIPECVGSMLVMLGYSYNSDNKAELDAAKKELVALKPHLLSITSTQYKQLLTSGKAVMALGWNGDALAAAAHKPVSYVVGKEGGEFWVDSYVIPVGAKNPDAAHAWIDYVYDPKHNAIETAYTYYGSPLEAGAAEGEARPEDPRERRGLPADEDARSPGAEQRHAQGNAAEEQDLDRVQERVDPPVPARRGRRRGRGGGPRYPGWLALPAVGWYAAFFLVPLGFVVAYSLAALSGFSDIAFDWNLDNYRALWDPLYGEVFIRTLGLALFGTATTLLIGFPFAYWIARYSRRKTLVLLFVVIPFWTSFLIRTYAWLIILDPQFPLFRVIHVDLLFTRPAVYIGVAYNYLPLMVLPLYAALERIDWSLVEAAQDLGDTPLRSFRRVTLPLAVPGVIAGSLLVFIPLTGEYLIPAILGGNKTSYAGSLIAQQFTRGARLAVRVGDRLRRDRRDDRRAARLLDAREPGSGSQWLGGCSAAARRSCLCSSTRRSSSSSPTRSTAAARPWSGTASRPGGSAQRCTTPRSPTRFATRS